MKTNFEKVEIQEKAPPSKAIQKTSISFVPLIKKPYAHSMHYGFFTPLTCFTPVRISKKEIQYQWKLNFNAG